MGGGGEGDTPPMTDPKVSMKLCRKGRKCFSMEWRLAEVQQWWPLPLWWAVFGGDGGSVPRGLRSTERPNHWSRCFDDSSLFISPRRPPGPIA